ncbi:hypothetical protein TWF191_003887 [Orbilia oligospora]|uniref:Uncharacterized protein n=1 Tax=Orbilia oligospora TaxID=2813651 RepID=A0A7C8V6K7_ORBOL|nr:hypothetical protein TWF191_003887 [Orbilia oligospora]
MLPMIAVHLGWPYAIGPAAGRSIALYTADNRSSATASSFKRLQVQLERPRAFVPGQYFLYDQSRLSFLAYLGLRIPQKVFISEVITVRQRNFPIFEVPGPAARSVTLEHKLYIEGPYGGLDIPAFTKWSKFFVLVAEDLGLGRQLFLLEEIIQQQYSQPIKLFLIWIIRRRRHVDSLINFYGWSMKEKPGNIECKVRKRQRIQLFIKIYGASLRVGFNEDNNNIYIDTNPQRYEHDCIPLIRDGIGWNGHGLKEGDFGSTSLSVCGSPRMIAGFDVLKNDWKALQNLKVLDTAVLD